MNNKPKPYIIVKAHSRKQRQQFKNKCHQQGITVGKAIPMLMQKVVDGEVSFHRVEEAVLVLNDRSKR